MHSDADLQALLASTYHRDGGAGRALTYWRGRHALAKDLLALRLAVRTLLNASSLLQQLGDGAGSASLRQRLEAAREQVLLALPEGTLASSASEPKAS